jgi:hypothetical protein
MNTVLPQREMLGNNWASKYPFKRRSHILYDFLADNNLLVANFCFEQERNYTFFRNDVSSYIDHIFIPDHLLENVAQCTILSLEADNTGDHLPVSINLDVKVPSTKQECYPEINKYPRPLWDKCDFKNAYVNEVEQALKEIKLINDATNENIHRKINDLCDSVCHVLHYSVETCLNNLPKKKSGKSKKWWTTDCFLAKQRNRLFYRIWKDHGKPSSGVVFENYKYSKKNYRKACRTAVKTQRNISVSTIAKLYKTNKPREMWNLIRKSKQKSNCNDAIKMSTLSDYFSDKFAALDSAEQTLLNRNI